MSPRHCRLAVVLALAVGFSLTSSGPLRGDQTGNVGLRDLVVLALQNDPGLVALRSNISVEEARKRAAVQWRDPELRAGLTKDDDFDNPTSSNNPANRNLDSRDLSNSIRVRFFIPKPSEMKALVSQAAREVDLAAYRVTAAEREVILEVRQQYEELQFLAKKLQAKRREIAVIEKHVANEQALLDAGGAFTLDQLSFEDIKIPGIELAIAAAETELQAAKRALAARVGLSDGSRIRVTDDLLRSGLDLQTTDLDYLTLMAFAHRGEVGILKHEQAIAEAELDLVKTKKIPWFSFIETDYAQDVDAGADSDIAYGVRVGVILPLFSWIAKEEKVANAKIEAYYASLEANQKNIANEVAEAFQSVQDATRHRARTRAAVARHEQMMTERAQALEASGDRAAQERLRYDTETQSVKFDEYVLAADRLFNQSLIRLEQALGADLDRVFRVEIEPLPGPTPPAQSVIRARPIPEASARTSRVDEDPSEPKGIFRFLKE